METNNNKLLTLLYTTPDAAERAYNLLVSKDYAKDDISVIMSDDTRTKYFSSADLPKDNLGTKAVEGMGVGSAIGGTVGAIAASIAAIGTVLAVPGLGLVIAGPLAAAFAGAGAGSAVGSLVGALAGYGYTDERVREYESDIKAGKILIAVNTSESNYNSLEHELKNII